MHYLTSTILAIAAISLPTTLGAPRPDTAECAGGAGSSGYTYTVTSKNDVAGTSQVGDYSVSGATGDGQLTQQSSYTVGVTVEVGLSLGLDFEDIAEAGDLSGSVSYTTETSTTQGVTDTCPQGGWYCALSITPTLVEVTGVATQNAKCGLQGLSSPYTILMPKLGSDGNPVLNAEACTCDNLPNWADAGHIGLLCPGACALPGSS